MVSAKYEDIRMRLRRAVLRRLRGLDAEDLVGHSASSWYLAFGISIIDRYVRDEEITAEFIAHMVLERPEMVDMDHGGGDPTILTAFLPLSKRSSIGTTCVK